MEEEINTKIAEFDTLKNKLIDISNDNNLNIYNKNRILKTIKE